jgi:Nicastrin
MDDKSTSMTCIAGRSCQPLGGYSVWASLPPLAASSARKQIIVLSHWDSSGLFRSAIGVRASKRSTTNFTPLWQPADEHLHDAVVASTHRLFSRTPGRQVHFTSRTCCVLQAAHSSYSGLMSMLIAVDALSQDQRGSSPVTLTHDIIFMTLTGESTGLMGSRRLLLELDQGSNSTDGLDLSIVSAVVEIGMTAAPYADNSSRLFTHTAGAESDAAAAFVDAASAVSGLQARFWLRVCWDHSLSSAPPRTAYQAGALCYSCHAAALAGVGHTCSGCAYDTP